MLFAPSQTQELGIFAFVTHDNSLQLIKDGIFNWFSSVQSAFTARTLCSYLLPVHWVLYYVRQEVVHAAPVHFWIWHHTAVKQSKHVSDPATAENRIWQKLCACVNSLGLHSYPCNRCRMQTLWALCFLAWRVEGKRCLCFHFNIHVGFCRP